MSAARWHAGRTAERSMTPISKTPAATRHTTSTATDSTATNDVATPDSSPILRTPEEASVFAAKHIMLAYWITRRAFKNEVLRLDMEQEAFLGLHRCAERYDESRGATFATYAVASVRGYLFRVWRQSRCVGHIPEHVTVDFRTIERTHPETPTVGEVERCIAARRGYSSAETSRRRWDARAYYTFTMGERSLSEVVNDDGGALEITLEDTIEDEESESAEETADATSRRRFAHDILDAAGLTDREREVIARRFGLGGRPEETLQEIADDFRVSRERIRQIEARALRLLHGSAVRLERRAEALANRRHVACDSLAA